MNRLVLYVLIFTPFVLSPAHSDEMNLATCLLGEYSDICNHSLLTKEQAQKVEQAESRVKYDANIETCSAMLYSQECDINMLSASDRSMIEQKYSHAKPNPTQGKSRLLDYTLNFGRRPPGYYQRYANENDQLPPPRSSRKTGGTSTMSNIDYGLIDVTTGTHMPRGAGGYIDPRDGTFHVDAAGGVINTKTGQFTPTFK